LIFEIGILFYSLITSKNNKTLRWVSLIGIIMISSGLLFISPFRRRYFCIVTIAAYILVGEVCNSIKLRNKSGIILISSVFLYLLNSLAGDLYFWKKNWNNTSYSVIEREITSLNLPQHTTILTDIHFWIPFSKQFTISNKHVFPIKNHASYKDFLKKNEIDYIFLPDYLLKNLSPTTGLVSKIYKMDKDLFLLDLKKFVKTHGILVKEIHTRQYDTLKLYKLKSSN